MNVCGGGRGGGGGDFGTPLFKIFKWFLKVQNDASKQVPNIMALNDLFWMN
jgi:hypothetical protein